MKNLLKSIYSEISKFVFWKPFRFLGIGIITLLLSAFLLWVFNESYFVYLVINNFWLIVIIIGALFATSGFIAGIVNTIKDRKKK